LAGSKQLVATSQTVCDDSAAYNSQRAGDTTSKKFLRLPVVNINEALSPARIPLGDGRYIGVVADLKPREISGDGREGAEFVIKITEGEFKARLVAVKLITAGPAKGRVEHDLLLLKEWRNALGANGAPTSWSELIEQLRAAAAGKRLEFALNRNTFNGFTELRLTSVQVIADV
jgi:hypothetical protein